MPETCVNCHSGFYKQWHTYGQDNLVACSRGYWPKRICRMPSCHPSRRGDCQRARAALPHGYVLCGV